MKTRYRLIRRGTRGGIFYCVDIRRAYGEFEQRAGQLKAPRGAKSALVLDAIERQLGEFSVADLQRECPGVTRRQRADRFKRQHVAMFNYLGPEAREILNDLLEKYASDGELQFTHLLQNAVARHKWPSRKTCVHYTRRISHLGFRRVLHPALSDRVKNLRASLHSENYGWLRSATPLRFFPRTDNAP